MACEYNRKSLKGHLTTEAKHLLSVSGFSSFEDNSEIIFHAFKNSFTKNVLYVLLKSSGTSG